MKWLANLPIACWLIWALRSLTPFAGKADQSITWRSRDKVSRLSVSIGIPDSGGFQCREPKVQGADARRTCTGGEVRSLLLECFEISKAAIANRWGRMRPIPER